MNLVNILQRQEIISIREFIKNLSKITSNPKKKVYTLVKNGKEVGFYIPSKYKDEVFADQFIPSQEEKKYKSLLDGIDTVSFKGDPDLSQKIDEIVYGRE